MPAKAKRAMKNTREEIRVSSALEELRRSREDLSRAFSQGSLAHAFQEAHTEITDQYFRASLQESKVGCRLFKNKHPFALVALGGYGRGELCLHSDIDIMVLFKGSIPAGAKELVEEILFPLWDMGLDLGYAIRSLKDCLNLSKNDFEVLTSMMDGRFLCGDSPLFLSLCEELHSKVISKRGTAFGRWLKDQDQIRMDRFGDASHLLEPHLKEGIGGLRDYHHILWLARAFFQLKAPRDLEYTGKLSHDEYRDMRENLNLIWLVRNHLHQLSGRKNDRLGFEYQEKVAHRLGFKDEKHALGVEQFMGRLHASMAAVKSLHRSFTHSHIPKGAASKKDPGRREVHKGLHVAHGELHFDSATSILSNPLLLIEAFYQTCALDRPLSLEVRRLIREFLFLGDEGFRHSQEAVERFLALINHENAFEGLNQMYETGFLVAFIPEFGPVKDRVQFDAYHIFPVGRHVLETVRRLKGLAAEKEILLLDIFSDLANPEPLLLAALFHDIGKVGKNHALRAIPILENILKRFAYPGKEAKVVLSLVRHHLLLVETATRRDLNDEKVVVQCARTIGDVERLKMLYLLTWADSKATGPRAWSDWTASLVQELFFKCMHILQGEELATPGASQRARETQSEVRGLLATDLEGREVEDFFAIMSPRYILNTPPRDMARHILAARELKRGPEEHQKALTFSLESREDLTGGCWEVTFLALDRPGLFSDVAGVLALNNINILAADIYTWADGTAVDIFKVTSPLDPTRTQETWKKVTKDLEKTFKGKLSLPYRLGQKSTPSIISNVTPPSRPAQIHVDNAHSDFFTLIEVFADDRIGLLYLITRTLFDLRLDIRIAKIATKGDQIADVFYVRDLEGQKVEDKEQVEEVKKALLHQLQVAEEGAGVGHWGTHPWK